MDFAEKACPSLSEFRFFEFFEIFFIFFYNFLQLAAIMQFALQHAATPAR